MTDYQSAVFNLAREKAQAYFSANPLDLTSITTEIKNIADKYSVPVDIVDDHVSSEYKKVIKRTIECASRFETKS
jgi:fructose/tagatose bisphosphate aldolase